MKQSIPRRTFIRNTAAAGLGLTMAPLGSASNPKENKRIGIIGLDTSHSAAFTREFNNVEAGPEMGGYKVIAAYPHGSKEIESSYSRIPGYTEEMKKLGVQIVDSIDELLKNSDFIMLETNDGRLHLEQAIPVIESGKTLFIDKPMTASLSDAIIIFNQAKKANVPVFSTSSLRYVKNAQLASKGEIGKIVGATTYGPAELEATHPDLFWYGIHGVELLYTVMGTGCRQVTRTHTESTDVAVGVWEDGRVGAFMGNRRGKYEFGGAAFGENGNLPLSPYEGYKPMLLEIVKFFQSGVSPVPPEETLEILAFMEAADQSKISGGGPVEMEKIWDRANKKAQEFKK